MRDLEAFGFEIALVVGEEEHALRALVLPVQHHLELGGLRRRRRGKRQRQSRSPPPRRAARIAESMSWRTPVRSERLRIRLSERTPALPQLLSESCSSPCTWHLGVTLWPSLQCYAAIRMPCGLCLLRDASRLSAASAADFLLEWCRNGITRFVQPDEALAHPALRRRGRARRLDPQGGRPAQCHGLGGEPPDHGSGGRARHAAVRAPAARRAAHRRRRGVRAATCASRTATSSA